LGNYVMMSLSITTTNYGVTDTLIYDITALVLLFIMYNL